MKSNMINRRVIQEHYIITPAWVFGLWPEISTRANSHYLFCEKLQFFSSL